jgi:hypothetical protein
MTTCISKQDLLAQLSAIQGIYRSFLQGVVNSSEASDQIVSLLSAISSSEKNNGLYEGRIVSLFPSEQAPVVTLNLLYRACLPGTSPPQESPNSYFQVSLTLLPNPNLKDVLTLTPSSDTNFADGRVTGGSDLANLPVNFIVASNGAAEQVVETLLVCGDGVQICPEPKKPDFLSYLVKELNQSFTVRRDKCGRLWLVVSSWDNAYVPASYSSDGLYYVNYSHLREYYSRKSCFTFSECDPAYVVSFTSCYEIWISNVFSEQDGTNTLTVKYATNDYTSLPKCFRFIIDAIHPVCVEIPNENLEIKKNSTKSLLICTSGCLQPFGQEYTADYQQFLDLYCSCYKEYDYSSCCKKKYPYPYSYPQPYPYPYPYPPENEYSSEQQQEVSRKEMRRRYKNSQQQ